MEHFATGITLAHALARLPTRAAFAWALDIITIASAQSLMQNLVQDPVSILRTALITSYFRARQ